MSLRLSAALGTSPEFWLKMQGQYDLWHARKKTPKVRRFPPPQISTSSGIVVLGTTGARHENAQHPYHSRFL